MKKHIPGFAAGAALFLIGMWGGHWLYYNAPEGYGMAGFFTGLVVCLSGLAVGAAELHKFETGDDQ